MSSRDTILNKIKASLQNTSRVPDDPDVDEKIASTLKEITPDNLDGLVEQFRKELEIVAGEFLSAKNEKEALPLVRTVFAETKFSSYTSTSRPLPLKIAHALQNDFSYTSSEQVDGRKTALATMDIGIVDVDYAVAESGTLAVSFHQLNSTLPHFLPDVIIALVYKDQLLANLYELFSKIDIESAKDMTLITGPSRTADIEKILILGAHGPRRLVVIMIDER
jgi:L-lactate dehydrogenase complex protein LldG